MAANTMNTCTRCGGKFPTRTSGIDADAVVCMDAASCDANLTRRVARIVEAAQADLGEDLGGGSMLDLCADNINLPLADLRAALTRAGFTYYEVK